jgi:hypothetical protein
VQDYCVACHKNIVASSTLSGKIALIPTIETRFPRTGEKAIV